MLLRGDHGAAGANIGLRLGIGRGRLLEFLPCAGFGLRQRLLAFLLLVRLDFLRERRYLLRLGLCDGGVLQFDLIVQIVEGGLRSGNVCLGLCDLGLIVGRIDLYQQIAGLDALKVIDGNNENFTRNPAAQPRQLGTNIGVIRRLDRGATDPGVPAQRRQCDKAERDQHGE